MPFVPLLALAGFGLGEAAFLALVALPLAWPTWFGRALARRLERRFGLRAPLGFVDHHRCHAASAYFTQADDDCLVATLDCHGDGLSGTISLASGGRLTRVAALPATASLGSFYAAITHHLGFHHHRHEGKVTGLAAYGDPEPARADVERMIAWDPARRRLVTRLGRNQFTAIARVAGFFSRAYAREEIAAAAQRHLERIVVEILRSWLRETGRRRVLLAGGVFGNVKLNQRIHELEGVEQLFIYPNMGDGGCGTGIAMLTAMRETGGPRFGPIEHVYLGPGFTEAEIRSEIERAGLAYEQPANLAADVARRIHSGQVVGRFDGRMEYGPRALGNRSILYHAREPDVNQWLNHRLGRTEFMPFAPVTLWEAREKCYVNLPGAEHTAEFMTMTFDCTDWMRKNCPAAVHVDGTARPQLVTPTSNPSFHAILTEFHKLTGVPSVINTSFNMHEEPIVCSPNDAIRAFLQGNLEYLAIGQYLVAHPSSRR